jgi:3-(3-hydroxy-phenyl)propionate hydroxylase
VRNETDIALIGYGPTGATLANLLGARGWRVEAFDRAHDVYAQPRAVHFDDEIMRVWQQLDMVEALAPAITEVRGMDMFNAEGDLIFQYVAPAGVGPLGWPKGYMFYQPDVERALRAGAARYPQVRAHLGYEVTNIAATGHQDVVVATAGPDGPEEWHARFAIGCDGARSMTRVSMGASLSDYGAHQPWLVLDILLHSDPGLPQVTVQYCDPARPSTYVPMPGLRRRFEIMVMPGDVAETLTRPELVARLLERWVQPGTYTLERAAVYTFHCLVADRWRVGPVAIAGDAAHQMPPFLGQGMCSGVRDAVNLAWKLDLVLRGCAGEAFLDTYQAEREPHVRTLIETDIYLGGIIQTTDPEVARQRDAMALSGGAATALTPTFPPLGGDLCGAGPVDRLPFPQPMAADGSRLDSTLGDGFVLVGGVTPSPQAEAILQTLAVRRIPIVPESLREWFAAAGAAAALVRPDRVVLAAVSDAESLDAALAGLGRYCRPAAVSL